MSDVSGILLLFLMAGVLVAMLVLYGVGKISLRLRRSRGQDSNVDFVVDTFHGLISQLKAKERELEVLMKRAEDRAGVMEDYNENILQSVPSGVISLDGAWRIVKVNSSAERIFGLRAEDIIGKDAGEVLGDAFRNAPEDGPEIPLRRRILQYVTASGRRLWLGYSLTPLLNSDGDAIGRLFVFTDLTELKAFEHQAELRQRLSSLGEMSAGMAHELRNPMGVIAGYMRLLSIKAAPELKKTVDAVSEEVSTMDRIISDFLSFARPRELKLSDLNLYGLIEECVRNVVGERKDVEVSMNIARDTTIRADGLLLRQAFTNLVQNALEAQEEGGRISFTSNKGEDHVSVLVSDEGHGIEEGIRDRIFLPFYTTKEKGTGLGLALVHRIITSHGGSIDLVSEGKGAAFRVRLPLNAG